MKKILMAAVATVALGVGAAQADPVHGIPPDSPIAREVIRCVCVGGR